MMINYVFILTCAFILIQLVYLASMSIDLYFYTRPVNSVDMHQLDGVAETDYPYIVLFYPVLKESEATMRTTMYALARLDYPKDKYSVIAIPNDSDTVTVTSLHHLQQEFPFLEVLEVPPTTDPSWQVVWDSWSTNKNAYWFHSGKRTGVRALPPKKTRQLIYAFYTTYAGRGAQDDFLVNYIDADSAPLPSHFKAGAAGIRQYDVVQSTNIAGNLLQTLPASWFAFDHIIWDANKYAHLTADGKHPFWVLGKGLFYKASDLYELGGFHPWITIEDPEVGMRFWKHGRRLGVIQAPLIEEVPRTIRDGITQRKRWVAGFFQSLHEPLRELGYTRRERVLAWMNFLPCLSLVLNSIGLPLGLWGVFAWWEGDLSIYVAVLGFINFAGLFSMWIRFYYVAWTKARIVLPNPLDRIKYIARVNPVFLWLFWVIWIIPLWLGWRMYRKDTGLVWDRTVKHDSNHQMVRDGWVTGDR